MNTSRTTILFTTIVTAFLFLSVFYVSCKKEEKNESSVDTACVNVNCNNGDCYKGECGCYPGYEGFYCDIKNVSRYLGNWNAVEKIITSTDPTRINATQTYTFSIIPVDTSALQFYLIGLMNTSDTVLFHLGSPKSHEFDRLGFYLNYSSLKMANVSIVKAGGWITSSGSIMDSLGYERNFELDTLVKETVLINAQKM